MRYPNSLQFLDFYYNGKFLSSFSGYIGGTSGLGDFSMIPSTERKTEKIPNRHGEIVYSTTFNPRTFTIPVYFTNIDLIRDVASWLYTESPSDFYIVGDNLKISCMIDTNAVDVEHGYIETSMGFYFELKFIAYDPFFYNISDYKYIFNKFDRTYTQINPLTLCNPTSLTITDRYTQNSYEVPYNKDYKSLLTNNLTNTVSYFSDGIITQNQNVITTQISSFNSFQLWNDGNYKSFETIKIYGTGNITVGINGETFTINNVNGYVSIDTNYMSVYKNVTDDMMNNYVGNFLTLKAGINTISVTGNVTSVEIQCNSIFI